MDDLTVRQLEFAIRYLYLSGRWVKICEELGDIDDLIDSADRGLIGARNRLEALLGLVLANYGVHADVELHRISVDGVE